MRSRTVLAIFMVLILGFGYLYHNLNMGTKVSMKAYASEEESSSNNNKIKEELIVEMKKQTNSLIAENEYLKQELTNLKKQLNKEKEEIDAKFHGHTIYFTLDKRYSTLFRENAWKDGSKFSVKGNVYSSGIGFNRLDNGDRNYYTAKLYNYNGEYSKLTGYIGIDDLAKDLSDSKITFSVFNNDNIIKCNNEFYGDLLYKTQFKKSDELKQIDVNLKGANNIIIEFSVDQKSDLNYFLLLEPKLK